jgi:hypothetical protein
MIRYLIVEDDAEIILKDMEGAYIKFKNDKKETSGVIEFIEINKNKTRLKINFNGAHYKLVLFLKKFDKKLFDEQNSIHKKE